MLATVSLPTSAASLQSASPDVIITVIIFGLVVYGLLLGQDKVKTLAMSVYVGLVVSQELENPIHHFLASKFGNKLSLNTVGLILFIAPLFLLEFGRRHHSSRGRRRGMIITLVLCILTAALIVASGLRLLDQSTLHQVLGDSNLATAIYGLRMWWIGLVPLAVIAESYIKPKE